MSTIPPCLQLLRLGECFSSECPFEHETLPHCRTCQLYFESDDALVQHAETEEHVTRLEATMVDAEQLASRKIHCKLCHADFEEEDWSRHVSGAGHGLKAQYRKFKEAKGVAEADKGNVNLTPKRLDFGLVEFADLNPNTASFQRVKPLVIKASKVGKVHLESVELEEKLQEGSSRRFTVQKITSPVRIVHGQPLKLSVHFNPRNDIGSYSDVLSLKFKLVTEDGKTEHFTIGRSLTGSVGVKSDVEAFSSTTPYSPPDLRNRPRPKRKDIVRAPRAKSKGNINWAVQLPYFVMPPARLLRCLENSSIREVLKRLRKFPGALAYNRYQIFWKTLLQVEAFQEDVNIRRYDIDDTTLSLGSNGFYHLNVPGLAEKRPSVTVNDLIKVKTRDSEDNRWFEGIVVSVESRRVGLKFKSAFDPPSNSRFDVQFHINRLPIRRQLQALELPLPRRDLLFPNLGTHYNGYPVADQHPPFFHRAIEANFCQRQAVLSIFYSSSGSAPYVVFGPPGTGKTVTIIETCLQLLQYLDATILLTAPSNAAADLLCTRLNLDESVVLRLNAPTRSLDDVAPGILEFSYFSDGHFSCPPVEHLKRYKVIVSTCISAGILRGVGLQTGHFTHIFVDEAGQATEPETLIPVSFASDATNLILAGDPKQLGPILQSAVTRQLGLETSMLERIMTNPLYQHENFAYRGVTYTKLVQNYRNHPSILATPNEEFYSNELQAFAPQNVTSALHGWEGWPKKDFPIIFHSVKGQDERDGVDPSFFNVAEISTIKNYVHSLTSSRNVRVLDSDIGVISPYAAQCSKLRIALQQNVRPNLTIGTVEQFQGSERSVILLSTVRSNKHFLEQDKRFAIGFLGNEKRFNVAVTRPQAGLIVVGDPDILTLDPLWRRKVFVSLVFSLSVVY
ncbi:hypothetical protein JCM5350_003555 [Sporobolomyces pararoseus]